MLGPSLFFSEPSQAFWYGKQSGAEQSQAELFAFKTKPNRAFGYSKLSYFWLFSVDFFKEYNFLEEKTHINVFWIIPIKIGKTFLR